MQNKLQFRKVSKQCKCYIHNVRNVGNDGLNFVCYRLHGADHRSRNFGKAKMWKKKWNLENAERRESAGYVGISAVQHGSDRGTHETADTRGERLHHSRERNNRRRFRRTGSFEASPWWREKGQDVARRKQAAFRLAKERERERRSLAMWELAPKEQGPRTQAFDWAKTRRN